MINVTARRFGPLIAALCTPQMTHSQTEYSQPSKGPLIRGAVRAHARRRGYSERCPAPTRSGSTAWSSARAPGIATTRAEGPLLRVVVVAAGNLLALPMSTTAPPSPPLDIEFHLKLSKKFWGVRTSKGNPSGTYACKALATRVPRLSNLAVWADRWSLTRNGYQLCA